MISIDVGSGFTKFVSFKDEGFLPSIVAPCPQSLSFGSEGAKIVQIGNSRFLIGNDAQSFAKSEDDFFETLTYDWPGSQAWLALIYAVVATSGVVNGKKEAVRIVTGLPQGIYLTKKQEILDMLKGAHAFLYMDKEFEVVFDPMVIPQAAAPFTCIGDVEDAYEFGVGIIDVGTYTTGLSVIENRNFIERKSASYPIGVSQLVKEIQAYAKNQYNLHLSAHKATSALQKKMIRYKGENIDISEKVKSITMSVASEMLEGIKEKWPGQGFDLDVFIAGGGALFFEEAIQTVVPHARVMDDPFLSVARGMLYFLEAKSKK